MKQAHVKKKKIVYNAGAMTPGMAFVVLTILVCISMSALMVGNIIPKGKSPAGGQEVVVQGVEKPQAAKGRLQLYYLKGATYTPTPNPTFAVPDAPTGVPGDPIDDLKKIFF